MLKPLMKSIIFLLIFILLVSCDALVGEDGVVVDSETGIRISDVSVKMVSDKGAYAEDLTDSTGYFNVIRLTSYYDNDYTITFEKEGFELEIIDENYFRDSTTEFVTEGTKDTLIIKLRPN